MAFLVLIFEEYSPLIQKSMLEFLPFSKAETLLHCLLTFVSSVEKSAAIFQFVRTCFIPILLHTSLITSIDLSVCFLILLIFPIEY